MRVFKFINKLGCGLDRTKQIHTSGRTPNFLYENERIALEQTVKPFFTNDSAENILHSDTDMGVYISTSFIFCMARVH